MSHPATGVTLIHSYFKSGNLIFEKQGTGATNGIQFGTSDTSIDMTWYGDTASAYVLFDQSGDEVIFEGIDLQLNDGDFIKLGDSEDITLNFDGTNLELESAAAATTFLVGADSKLLNTTLKGTLTIGKSDVGHDVRWYSATASASVLFDESGDEVIFDGVDLTINDGDFLNLGDSKDITLNFDGTNLELESAAAATTFLMGADSKLLNTTLKGTLTVGKNDTGHDVIFYGATSGKSLTWDESADQLIILGSADLGTSCEADAYTVGGTAGADFASGAVTNIHVIKGVVVYCA